MQPPQGSDPIPPPAPAPAPAAPAPRPAISGLWETLLAVGIIWATDALVMVAAAVTLELTGHHADKTALYWGPLDAAITLTVCWFFACRRRKRTLAQGLGLEGAARPTVALAAVGGVGLALLFAVFTTLGIGTGKTPMEDMMKAVASAPGGGLLLLVIALVMGAVEELYYRGFIFPALSARWGGSVATAVVAGWFGLMHVPQLWGNWVAIAYVGSVGLSLTLLRRYTGSTLPGLAAHLAYNGTLTFPEALASLARLLRHAGGS